MSDFQFNDGSEMQFNDGESVEYGSVVINSGVISLNPIYWQHLKNALPIGWFQDNTPVIDALMNGFVWCVQLIMNTLDLVIPQMRIKTSTGGFLDIIGNDFFGTNLQRLPNEKDSTYLSRILSVLFQSKNTYAALYDAVSNYYFNQSDVSIALYEYGMFTSGNLSLEDGVTDINNEDSTTVDLETSLQTIPNNSFPVGLNFQDAAVRYSTDLQPYESLLILSGASLVENTIDNENDTPILMEDGTNMDNEFVGTLDQSLFNLIERIKPVGTVVWVSI